jgi:hypothetical protein
VQLCRAIHADPTFAHSHTDRNPGRPYRFARPAGADNIDDDPGDSHADRGRSDPFRNAR